MVLVDDGDVGTDAGVFVEDCEKNSPSKSDLKILFLLNGSIILKPNDPFLFLKSLFIPILIIENDVLVP